ncbi:MAG: IS1595 family transposase [Gammaproteobacteria bacterium]|nr:IS1595 family transposase [Gammaproteobacteria bacterium]
MSKTFTVTEFFKRFPDDDSCLDHLMLVRHGETLDCPKCGKHGKFSRIKKLPAYQCSWCGHHIHPKVGTPFEKSRTPLQKWFYAMYLFTTSRHGVPAKELQRQLGVTYKCAWRMGHEIRKYMADTDGDNGLSGHVEVDEAYIGGKDNLVGMPTAKRGSKKVGVLGMVQRGGDIITRVIPDATIKSLLPHVVMNVKFGSTISSDELSAYKHLYKFGFNHSFVRHSIKQWKRGIHHTNTIEGYWSHLKKSISGTHIHVSRKHMAKYLGEFEYRYNMRDVPHIMFNRLLLSF